MDQTDKPGPSGVKRHRSLQIRNPKKLADEEMLAILKMSDFSYEDDVSDDDIYELV